MTLRKLPSVGERVRVIYLGTELAGTIVMVSADLHDVDVRTEDGATTRFRLNRATARFVSVGPDQGARLIFTGPDAPR
jgi:hypothetical protein